MTRRRSLLLLACGGILLAGSSLAALWWWWPRPAKPEGVTWASRVRAARRAYDGAPPVIPHPPLGGACTTCHTDLGREVPGIGQAPPNPHRHTPGLSDQSRCQQCHVFRQTNEELVANTFQGLGQDLRRGERLYAQAPPVIPHGLFMREDCVACHAGPSVRPEIRCTHPDRLNCRQCHASRVVARLGP